MSATSGPVNFLDGANCVSALDCVLTLWREIHQNTTLRRKRRQLASSTDSPESATEATPIVSTGAPSEGSRVLCGISMSRDVAKHPRELLHSFVVIKNSLDTELSYCKKKLDLIDKSYDRDPLKFSELTNFARRISPHVRAPPEYSDPAGIDPYCVPGYFFPCPDKMTITRSALFHANLMKAVPPTITFERNAKWRSVYTVDIQTPTAKASIFYSINGGPWSPYNSSVPPTLNKKMQYILRAYCTASMFLTSEVNVLKVDLTETEDDETQQSTEVASTTIVSSVSSVTTSRKRDIQKQYDSVGRQSEDKAVAHLTLEQRSASLGSSAIAALAAAEGRAASLVVTAADFIPPTLASAIKEAEHIRREVDHTEYVGAQQASTGIVNLSKTAETESPSRKTADPLPPITTSQPQSAQTEKATPQVATKAATRQRVFSGLFMGPMGRDEDETDSDDDEDEEDE